MRHLRNIRRILAFITSSCFLIQPAGAQDQGNPTMKKPSVEALGPQAMRVFQTPRSGAVAPYSDVVEGDPQFYFYYPHSALGLGLGFDPADTSVPKRPCIAGKKEPIDPGAVGTQFQMTYVKNWNQLNTAMRTDAKIDASYLTFKGNAEYTIDTSSAFEFNSITIVLRAWSDFGRWGLTADAKLIDEAHDDLQKDPRKFASKCGIRYVAIERRGATVSAVITLASVGTEFKKLISSLTFCMQWKMARTL